MLAMSKKHLKHYFNIHFTLTTSKHSQFTSTESGSTETAHPSCWKIYSTGRKITNVRCGERRLGFQGCLLISESSKHLRSCQSFQIYMLTGPSAVFNRGKEKMHGIFLSDNLYSPMLKCKKEWKHIWWTTVINLDFSTGLGESGFKIWSWTGFVMQTWSSLRMLIFIF